MIIGDVKIDFPELESSEILLENVNFFTPYMRHWLNIIQKWLLENNMPILVHIKYTKTSWLAFSDDKTVGWYKYTNLGGQTYQKLLYNGKKNKLPPRTKMHF